MSVLEIQQALKAAGFDPGALDGKMGPHTRSAIEAYQRAHGLTVDGIAGPKTQAALQGSAGAATGSSASADTQADAKIKADNPQWGFLLDDPEIGPILREGLPAEQLEFRIKQTNWYRSRTDAERNFLALAATDPAEAQRRLAQFGSAAKYVALANSYGQQVSFDWALKKADEVVRGVYTADDLENQLRDQARALFPYLAQQLDQGQTVADVWEPIKNVAANTLGVNPASIQLSDPKWSQLLQTSDGKGGFRLASLAEAQQRIESDPRYGFDTTQNGRDSTFALTQAINQGFGFQ